MTTVTTCARHEHLDPQAVYYARNPFSPSNHCSAEFQPRSVLGGNNFVELHPNHRKSESQCSTVWVSLFPPGQLSLVAHQEDARRVQFSLTPSTERYPRTHRVSEKCLLVGTIRPTSPNKPSSQVSLTPKEKRYPGLVRVRVSGFRTTIARPLPRGNSLCGNPRLSKSLTAHQKIGVTHVASSGWSIHLVEPPMTLPKPSWPARLGKPFKPPMSRRDIAHTNNTTTNQKPCMAQRHNHPTKKPRSNRPT